ncbi:hypothetical protein RF55_17162, partial [Lasius niger]
MSKEVEPIVRTQFDLYGRISRAYENVKKAGAANITIGLVEARLQALEANWAKYEANHERLSANYWDLLSGHDYLKKDMMSLTEEAYLTQKGLLLESLRVQRMQLAADVPTVNVVAPPAPSPPRTTLPRIQLPQFSGLYEEWPSFRDLFNSLVVKDAATTQVEKLHYLKTCLKGEAELLIRSLSTTEENFGRAWRILGDYYENKRLLVRSHIAKFTALQKMKGESASELRKLYHCMVNTVGSLESLGRPITRGEDLFVHLVVELLDSRSRREWENVLSDTTDPPSYAELQQFLDRRLHTLESLQPLKTEINSPKTSANTGRQARVQHARKPENKRGRCSMCQQDHYIMFCDVYKTKSASERKQHVETNNLCLNCLGRHKVSDCASKKACSACGARHHSTIHDACNTGEVAKSSHAAHRASRPVTAVLLATARVRVVDRFGAPHIARALIDQGSEASLVAESLAQRLRLQRSPTSVSVFGVGGKLTGVSRGLIDLEISSLGGSSPITVSALILPRLTLYNSGIRADRRAWKHLDGLELADPEFLASDPVELLLGAEVYASILQEGLLRGGPQEPMAQKTSLGWILSGTIGSTGVTRCARTYQCQTDGDLSGLVQRFWQQEEVGAAAAPLSAEERKAEDHFTRTHYRRSDGR